MPASQLVQARAPPGMGSGPKPRRVETVIQPGPPGRTRREKGARTAAVSGGVAKVTTSQTMVLPATVTSITTAVALGSLGAKRGAMKAKPATLRAKLAIMAENPVQAFMRHQYQRRMRTRPVPAPRPRRSSQARSMLESCEVTPIDARKISTVAARETAT